MEDWRLSCARQINEARRLIEKTRQLVLNAEHRVHESQQVIRSGEGP